MLMPAVTPKPKALRITTKNALEKTVEGKVKRYAKDHGFYVRKFVSPGFASVPDDILVAPGKSGASPEDLATTLFERLIFIEFKRPGECVTEAQAREHDRMRGYGLPVVVIDNVDAGMALIDFYLERSA